MYDVILFVIFCATVGGTETVGVFRGEKQGCLTLHHQPATWWDAREKCFLEGAVLASPDNDYEYLMDAMFSSLQALSNDSTYIHTGIHNTYSNKHFYTLEGVPLAKLSVPFAQELNQVSDTTTSTSNDTCLGMYNGVLTYNNCTDVLPYFCFKRIDPNDLICGCKEDGYKCYSRTKSCYKFYSELHTWSEAFGVCSSDGGHLAIINSGTEAEVLRDFYGNAKDQTGYDWEVAFIGFKEVGNQDDRLWMTIHGQSLEEAGYNKWHTGQPENRESGCGAMYGTDDLLDDFYCDRRRGFICEKAPINGHTEHTAGTTYFNPNNMIL